MIEISMKLHPKSVVFNRPYDIWYCFISGKYWKVFDLGSQMGSKNDLSRLSFLKGYDFVLKCHSSNLHEHSTTFRRTFWNIPEHSRTTPNIRSNSTPYGYRSLEQSHHVHYYDTFVNNKQNIHNSIFMRLLRLFSLNPSGIFLALRFLTLYSNHLK